MRREFVTGNDFAVGGRIFFLDDFHGGKVRGKAGAGEFVSLLRVVTLGHEDEVVALGQLGESCGNAGQEFDLLPGDGVGKAANALGFLFSHGLGAQALKAGDQRAGEAAETVAVGKDGFALDGVEGLAHFSRCVGVVIEVADEGGDGPLEVDVVFPEGVVGIDEQGLTRRELGHRFNVTKLCGAN